MKAPSKWLSKIVLTAALAALVIVLMLYLDGAFSRKVSSAPGGEARAAVAPAAVAEVRLLRLPRVEQAPGTIRPLHEIALASKVREPEKIVEMNAVAGREVRQGDVLVRLDASTWQNRKELAEAKLASARAARDDANNAFERIQEAFRRNVATQAELDAAKFRLEAARAEAVAAQRGLDEAEMNLGYTKITAPVDAVVIDKRADVGDTVGPGQVLVSLYDKMQLIANVREGLMRNIKTGQSIDVYLDELGAACAGTVSEIVPQADPATRTFQVKVVGPCHAGVRPGMYAKLLVPLGEKEVLAVPPSAVRQVGQLTLVEVVGPTGLERRHVQLGQAVESEGQPYLQVLSGLKAGEKVALAAAGGAPYGQ